MTLQEIDSQLAMTYKNGEANQLAVEVGKTLDKYVEVITRIKKRNVILDIFKSKHGNQDRINLLTYKFVYLLRSLRDISEGSPSLLEVTRAEAKQDLIFLIRFLIKGCIGIFFIEANNIVSARFAHAIRIVGMPRNMRKEVEGNQFREDDILFFLNCLEMKSITL